RTPVLRASAPSFMEQREVGLDLRLPALDFCRIDLLAFLTFAQERARMLEVADGNGIFAERRRVFSGPQVGRRRAHRVAGVVAVVREQCGARGWACSVLEPIGDEAVPGAPDSPDQRLARHL